MQKKIVSTNKKAYHDFLIFDKFTAGLVLTGTEIKSIRKGSINLKDSFANIKNGECFVSGMHISPYEHGNIYNKNPLRDRKLLLHKYVNYGLNLVLCISGHPSSLSLYVLFNTFSYYTYS